jgi:hypothetical protein
VGNEHVESVGPEPDAQLRGAAPASNAYVAETPQALALRLQRTVGNASVCRLLSREPAGATAAPATPTWHKGLDAALPPDPQGAFDRLHKRVAAIAVEQAADAAAMKGDMKYWFARVYSFVTKRELAQIDAGAYQYPLMKMQQVIGFHSTYKRNLDSWRAGAKSTVEPNWKHAFTAAEDLNGGSYLQTRSLEIMNALLPAFQAHIRFDLPRAIAGAYLDNYASIPGLPISVFKPDFDAMDVVFEKASADVVPEIKAQVWYVDPGYSQTLQDLGFPFIFHIGIERRLAWEKAELLAASAHSRTAADMNKRLRGYIIGAHPNTGTEHFKVDGDQVDDFDWNAAP